MTPLLEFFVEGEPAATQTGSIGTRRVMARTPFGGREPKMVPYPVRRNRGWIDEFLLKAKRFRPRLPLTGPLELTMVFFLRPPKKPKHPLPPVPVGDPNPDNLGKGLADALEGDFYVNDAACSDMVFRKRWALDRAPGVAVTLSRVAL